MKVEVEILDAQEHDIAGCPDNVILMPIPYPGPCGELLEFAIKAEAVTPDHRKGGTWLIWVAMILCQKVYVWPFTATSLCLWSDEEEEVEEEGDK